MSDDLIRRADAIDAVIAEGRTVDSRYLEFERIIHEADAVEAISMLPSAQSEGWMERNEERILQAGMEGREIEFRIGGRLFAIREKAQ